MRKKIATWTLTGAVAVLSIAFVKSAFTGAATQVNPDPTPLIVSQVRGLGSLKSSEMAVQRVFEFERHLKPQGAWKHLPGAEWTVARATSNRAMLSAHGTITASVDLRQAEVRQTANGWVVTLPSAKLDEPVVTARLHAMQTGAFWKHHALPLEASKAMGDWTRDAARERQLTTKAQQEAEATLRQLLLPMTGPNLSIRSRT